MLMKSTLFAFLLFLGCYSVYSQENRLLLSFQDNTTKSISKGDYVRLSYPSAKLDLNRKGKLPELLGFRGKVDSIGTDKIWLRIDKRTSKKQVFVVDEIVGIKEMSKSAELLTFIGTSVVIGGAAVVASSALDMNSAFTAFVGAFSIFPAAILTANVFYPTKPTRKVGDGYKIKVITIN